MKHEIVMKRFAALTMALLLTFEISGFVTGCKMDKGRSDGTVSDANGSILAKVEDDGTIRTPSGRYGGKIESDGTVRNVKGSILGKVESDGTVRNASGKYLGHVGGVHKNEAAALFFFSRR